MLQCEKSLFRSLEQIHFKLRTSFGGKVKNEAAEVKTRMTSFPVIASSQESELPIWESGLLVMNLHFIEC